MTRRSGVLLVLLAVLTLSGCSTVDEEPPASASRSAAPAPERELRVDRTPHGVRMGRPRNAQLSVVIYEDFASGECRQLDRILRDRLRTAALAGRITVEYRPVFGGTQYSGDALAFWVGVQNRLGTATEDTLLLRNALMAYRFGGAWRGTDAQVKYMRAAAQRGGVTPFGAQLGTVGFTQEGFDGQMADAEAAGVRSLPWVLVDGEHLGARSTSALADRLLAQVGGAAS